MARINFIVPAYARNKFSGGLWCIFQYAHGLHKLGHDIRIVPILPSPKPEWFTKPLGHVLNHTAPELLTHAISLSFRHIGHMASTSSRKQAVRLVMAEYAVALSKLFPFSIQYGIAESYIQRVAPLADINIATKFDTVRPTILLPGRHFYLAQHFEPYFADEYTESTYAGSLAGQTYRLGLSMIANSSWLRDKILSETANTRVDLCPNAIDHEVFSGAPKYSADPKRVILISYGGRNTEWKGFREMASAVAITRAKMPDVEIEWRVYGEAALPSDNAIASYRPLGFLPPEKLAAAYREADILLSASWYESFPLFPIEAMACGLAVITTKLGTEDYAIPGETAELVLARSVESIADGLMRLIYDREYRFKIASGGKRASRNFTWDKSVSCLNEILLRDLAK